MDVKQKLNIKKVQMYIKYSVYSDIGNSVSFLSFVLHSKRIVLYLDYIKCNKLFKRVYYSKSKLSMINNIISHGVKNIITNYVNKFIINRFNIQIKNV